MKNMYMTIFVATLVVIGCAYIDVGLVCDGDGNCAPGVKIEGVICPDGRPAPNQDACDDPDREQLISLSVLYSSGSGASITQPTLFGVLRVYELNGSLRDQMQTTWSATASSQTLMNASAVNAWMVGQAASAGTALSFRMEPPTVLVSTGAPAGASVTLSATGLGNGVPIAASSYQYVAGASGGPLAQYDATFGDGGSGL